MAFGGLKVASSARRAEGSRPAFDVCDLEWGEARRGAPGYAGVGADWAIITEFSMPAPDRFIRDITTFVPGAGGLWPRDSEHHENVRGQAHAARSHRPSHYARPFEDRL
jgi:hypothetical protein